MKLLCLHSWSRSHSNRLCLEPCSSISGKPESSPGRFRNWNRAGGERTGAGGKRIRLPYFHELILRKYIPIYSSLVCPVFWKVPADALCPQRT